MGSIYSTRNKAPDVPSQIKKDVVTFCHPISVKLDENNFSIWKHQIVFAIRGHDLQRFIDKTVKPPPRYLSNVDVPDEGFKVDNPEYLDWERQDQLLAYWMSCSMTDAMLTRVVGCETSLQIWDKIQNHFAFQTQAKVQQLKSQLENTKKGNLTANEHLSKIKDISDSLSGIGHPISEADHIEFIFEGLGEEYYPLIRAMTARIEPYTPDEVESLLVAQEARHHHRKRRRCDTGDPSEYRCEELGFGSGYQDTNNGDIVLHEDNFRAGPTDEETDVQYPMNLINNTMSVDPTFRGNCYHVSGSNTWILDNPNSVHFNVGSSSPRGGSSVIRDETVSSSIIRSVPNDHKRSLTPAKSFLSVLARRISPRLLRSFFNCGLIRKAKVGFSIIRSFFSRGLIRTANIGYSIIKSFLVGSPTPLLTALAEIILLDH